MESSRVDRWKRLEVRFWCDKISTKVRTKEIEETADCTVLIFQRSNWGVVIGVISSKFKPSKIFSLIPEFFRRSYLSRLYVHFRVTFLFATILHNWRHGVVVLSVNIACTPC